MSIERTDIAVSDHQARVTRALDVSAPSVPEEVLHIIAMDPTAPFFTTCTCGWSAKHVTVMHARQAVAEHQHLPTNGAST